MPGPGLPAPTTGAPELYVDVLFHEFPEGDCFVARKPANHMWTRITGQSEAQLLVALSEANPANAMEAGLILPEPGQEQEWFDENRTRLTELGVTV